MYTDNSGFSGSQVFTGLQFTYGGSGAITLNYRSGSSWVATSLTSSSFTQGTVYTVEIVANNKSSGTINYSYNGNSQSVAGQKFDLYINGTRVGDDLARAELTAGNNINAATFIGVSSTSNVANIFVDDFVVYNAVPSSIGGGAETTPAAPVVASASAITTSAFTANWAASSGATKYYLDVATDSGVTVFVPNFSNLDVGNVTSYAVTGLSAGTTYYYKVRASNSAGPSASSGAQTALTTAAGTPSVLVSPTSATGLTNYVGQVSASTNYTVTGANLGGTNLVVTASTNAIEVSTNSSTGFTNSFSLAPSVDGTLTNTVYVRISALAPAGAVSAIVSNVSGVASNNFTISGTVTQPALTLVLSPTSVQESAGAGASTGTVGIPFSLTNDLTVSLVSSNTAAATVPSTVTITNGQTNATFDIAAVANTNSYTDVTAVITASQASYTSASATLTVQNVDVRVPTVVVNKFENTAPDVIELLVVGNGAPGSTVDMRGILIKDHSSDNASDVGGKYVFSSNSLWQAVPAGTLIVLTLDGAATDANVDGFIVRVGLNNTDYFTKGTGTMNLANTDMVMIKEAGSAEAGSVGMIHALANGASTQTQTAAAGSPKLVNNVGTAGVIYASNPNSTIADYNGSSVALGAAGTIPFGSANNPANAAFIAGLRGTKDISISIEANAVIVNEDAGVQADKITVALSVATTSDLTVNLSATPAGIVNLPESVTIPTGSSSVTVGFTPINDNTSAGNRTVTIGGSADTWNSANNTVTVVDVQYTNPSVVINEVVNQTSGDVVELLVIQNNLNMAGMILKDFSGDMGGDVGGSYTFTSNSLWQSVKAGTLIVLTRDATATEDTDASDGLVTVKLTNTTYFTAGGSFDISAIDMVMIKAAGAESSGITGAIHTFGNGPAGTLFKLANGAKLLFTAGGAGGGADNATSTIGDYNGTGVTGGTATLGAANNANNQTYITALRASVVVPPTITSTNAFSGTVGVAFSNTITATGSAPIAFSGTDLPGGLSVATNGVISGTPTAAGTFTNAVLTATNAAGTNNQAVTFTIAKGTPIITAVPTASAITAGQALSNSTISGGTVTPSGGTWDWSNPGNTDTVEGTNSYAAVYTPALADQGNYFSLTTDLSVTVNSADTPQEQYLASYGLVKGTPEAASTADPDGDGLNNAGEFAFGTSPVSGASRAVTQESVVGGIKIKWLQRSEFTYTVKSTDDLGSAFSGTVSSTPVSPQPDGLGDYQQYEATLTGGDRGFLKVEAFVP